MNQKLIMENWRRFLKEEQELEEGWKENIAFGLAMLGSFISPAEASPQDLVQFASVQQGDIENMDQMGQGNRQILDQKVASIVGKGVKGKVVSPEAVRMFIDKETNGQNQITDFENIPELANGINTNVITTNWYENPKGDFTGIIKITSHEGDDSVSEVFHFDNETANAEIQKAAEKVLKNAQEKKFFVEKEPVPDKTYVPDAPKPDMEGTNIKSKVKTSKL